MTQSSEAHLARLADHATQAALSGMGFGWTALDRNVCAVMRFKRHAPDAPAIVGLLGGASSGKSTLFNSLLGCEVSRISAHAHETCGPIAAVHLDSAGQLRSWLAGQFIFADFEPVHLADGETTNGKVGSTCFHLHRQSPLETCLVLDLPDVTSKRSADEGAITRNLLPWFDGLVIVADEERWFDAAVFDEIVEHSRNFGPRLWTVFNRTERTEEFALADREKLAHHATQYHSDGHCISPFQPGRGYRPVAKEAQGQLQDWLSGLRGNRRKGDLAKQIQRRCAETVRENVLRGERFDKMCADVNGQLSRLAADTSLSVDLLTAEERHLLGLRHRILPLYDVVRAMGRRLRGLAGRRAAIEEVNFEKRTEDLADVLRRNLEMRFRWATDQIDEITVGSRYFGDETEWSNTWRTPDFDETEWAVRIRAHIDAWKIEAAKQSRRGDLAAVSIGTPLLLADILFLGGAGVTMTWATAWLAGFFGGKSVAQLVQRSPALAEYQTTVRAYQTMVREALTRQWEANLAAMPRRHMKMTNAVLEALMYWATPGRAEAR